ncbi:MAG: VWA domain-containing protein, partial [Candidatus Zixiibacteriota bacterium]
MKRQTLIILVIPALILFFAATFIVATEYGSISGQITDSQTKQPLIGATVLLVGTYRRAQTDVHGKFTILRVSPGTYALKISAVGYSELLIKNVNVRTDLTVVVNNSLTPRTDELKDKIVVESERDIIDKFQTSNQTIIKKETIERQPVQTVDELIEKKAGVVSTSTGEVYIRGGRAFEVGYIVDGAPRAGVSSEDQAPEIGCKTPPAAKGKEVIQPSVPCMPPRRADYFPHVQGFQDMFFENYGHNPFESTSGDYKSTFAIDVDDASYTLCRSYLNQSALPPADAIRTEEFINHFDYNYPEPHNETFSVSLEGAPSRFGTNAHLLRIGIKGKTVDEEVRRSANLVFIVDVSGSMQWGNRINLLRETLHLLTEQLDRNDCVGIISYDETARIVLEPSPARNRKPIHQAINRLTPGGSTNAQAGLQLGFQMAAEIFNGSRINRVFLFSDGVANVGNTDPEALLREIKGYTDRGITLST